MCTSYVWPNLHLHLCCPSVAVLYEHRSTCEIPYDRTGGRAAWGMVLETGILANMRMSPQTLPNNFSPCPRSIKLGLYWDKKGLERAELEVDSIL